MKDSALRIRRLAVWVVLSSHVLSLSFFAWLCHQKARAKYRKGLHRKMAWIAGNLGHLPWQELLNWLAPRPAHAQNGHRNTAIPDHYPNLEELYERIRSLASQYPEVVALQEIGISTTLRLPIYALRVSDHPELEEDESAILFSGLHHAREPIGTLMCLRIVEWLAQNYSQRPEVRRLVDSLEIWVVPVVNPDGYKYMMDNFVPYPWWRKNLRDNDGDGRFDPVIDGVDLNRNYDFNWRQGGEGNPASWFFRGRAPFSEKEIAALRNLALRENILAGISFHSYGEVVLFPWGNYFPAPDHRLIVEIAQEMAELMQKLYGNESYGVLPLNGRVGQSSVWMYGRLRAIDYILELGSEHFPDRYAAERILSDGLRAVRYLLNRCLASGIRGHVLDAEEGYPVVANVYVTGFEADYVQPRRSERVFGRFDRLLRPGKYTIRVVADGYEPWTASNVKVQKNWPTSLEIRLQRQRSYPLTNH